MSKSILCTRPNHDAVTDYLYHWSERVIDQASQKHFKVLDLRKEKASRKNFVSYIRAKRPNLLFLNGHGTEDRIYGHNYETLIVVSDDMSLFAETVMYARCCESGKILGPCLTHDGMKAFIGYERKFTFLSLHEYSTRPLQDPIARLFIEPSNLIPTTLIKGHSAGTAYFRSQAAMRRNFQKAMTSSASFEERLAASYLWSNMKGQVLLGDANASL